MNLPAPTVSKVNKMPFDDFRTYVRRATNLDALQMLVNLENLRERPRIGRLRLLRERIEILTEWKEVT